MKVLFKTLGCKVNRYDTETLRELFACDDILSVNSVGKGQADVASVGRKVYSGNNRLFISCRRKSGQLFCYALGRF